MAINQLYPGLPQGAQFRGLAALNDQEIEQLAREIAAQELLSGPESLPKSVFGTPTRDALLHQLNIANTLLQAGEIDKARQRVEGLLPYVQTPTPQIRQALQKIATALVSTGEVPVETAMSYVPPRPQGTLTARSALQDYAFRSGLREELGFGIDPQTGQPGLIPQTYELMSLIGMALPGVLVNSLMSLPPTWRDRLLNLLVNALDLDEADNKGN